MFSNRCLFLLGASATIAIAQAQDTPIDALKLVVMVLHHHAEGVVKLNDIPVKRFDSSAAKEGSSATDSIGTLALYAQNGTNVLTIEVRPSRPDYEIETECRIVQATGSLDDLEKPPLFQQKIKGAGTITHNLVLRNVPHSAFADAEPWHGDKQDVLNAVRALHKAFADHDFKTISASLRPVFDEMSAVMGPVMGNFDDAMREMQQMLGTAKVDALPAGLKVQSFYGDRLIVVSREEGGAPIQITAAEIDQDTGRPTRLLESGAFWMRRDSRWVLIRQ